MLEKSEAGKVIRTKAASHVLLFSLFELKCEYDYINSNKSINKILKKYWIVINYKNNNNNNKTLKKSNK